MTTERLCVIASFRRPRVSNGDHPSEVLFRTCKDVPGWPTGAFVALAAARDRDSSFEPGLVKKGQARIDGMG